MPIDPVTQCRFVRVSAKYSYTMISCTKLKSPEGWYLYCLFLLHIYSFTFLHA